MAEAHNHLGLILSKQLETIENIFETTTLSFFYEKSKKNVSKIWEIKNKDAPLRRQTMTNIFGRFI